MDLGAMRRWLKQNDEQYMITERTYRALYEEAETDLVEFRLVMPYGDMDYTATVLDTAAHVQADRDAAVSRAFTRLTWETQRDTRVELDCTRAMENGRRYQEGR